MMTSASAKRALFIAALFLGSAAAADAAGPIIRNLDIAGLQIGGTTILTFDGDNLLPGPKVILSAPILRQALLPKGTANRVQIEVSLDKTAIPGMYNLRLATDGGISAARLVGLDHFPQTAWAEKIGGLPTALHGSLAGSKKLAASFIGKAGQAILCEVEARRLGLPLRPVLHLLDDQGHPLAWAWPTLTLGGDARLQATLPADARYTIEVHDAQYAAAPGTFRLKVGAWQFVDAVFPAAVRKGQQATLELIGSPGARPITLQADGKEPFLALPWANPAAASGLRPWVRVSEIPESVRKDGAAVQDAGAAPVAINGRLTRVGEADHCRLKVRPGDRLHFEVFAERLGSPLDAVLKLRRDNGALLAQADDSADSLDPVLDFTVPAGLETLVAAIEDLHGRGQANFVYRIEVRPPADLNAARDFRLFLPEAEWSVPLGGNRVVAVEVERRGYVGPVRLAFAGLPAGVQAQGTEVPAGANGALVTFTATGSTPTTGLVGLRGTSANAGEAITRSAIVRGHPLAKLQPWLAQELAIAVIAKQSIPFSLQWSNQADVSLVPGTNLKIPLAITPPPETYGGVRIYLMASHQAPLVNGQRDQNQSLRKDQGVFLELPAGKKDGEFNLQVPATLPGVPQDVAFRAELLSKDRRLVVAQAFTPVRHFAVLNPLVVRPAAREITATLDPRTGAVVQVAGTIERRAGFQGDVTVSLVGVPGGVAVPAVLVKAGKSEFQLALRLPGTFAPKGLKEIKVFATGRFNPGGPLLNRSEEVAVRVKLVPAAGPKK